MEEAVTGNTGSWATGNAADSGGRATGNGALHSVGGSEPSDLINQRKQPNKNQSVISGRDGTTQDMNRTLQDKTQTSLADRDAMGMNLVV